MSIPTEVERDLPPALKETQDPGWLPGLDIPDLTDDQLIAMARRIENHAHIRWCWHVLAYNRSSAAIRDAARRDLRKSLIGELCGDTSPGRMAGQPASTCALRRGHDPDRHANADGTEHWGTISVEVVINGDEFLERLRREVDRLSDVAVALVDPAASAAVRERAQGVRFAMSCIEELTR